MKNTIPYILICSLLLSGCGVAQKVSDQLSKVSDELSQVTEKVLDDTVGAKKTGGVSTFTLSDVPAKELTRDQQKELNGIVRQIKAEKDCHVTVIGHSDNTGTSEVNQSVSQARARMVADYLKGKGIAQERISVIGESYNHPVAGNDTAAGRARNRRVEIYISPSGEYNPYK